MSLNILDVSRFQSMAELEAVPLDQLDGIITCVTFGINGENPLWRQQHDWAKQNNKLFGGYHIRNGDGPTPQQEADFFLSAFQDVLHENPVMALDWEECDESQVGWASEWLDIVNARTGVMPLTYLNQQELEAYNWDTVAQKSSLWVAQYDLSSPIQGFQDMQPLYRSHYPVGGGQFKEWPVVAMWQYASTVYFGNDGPFDANKAYMDADAWHRYGTPTGQPVAVSAPSPAPAPAPATGPVWDYTVVSGDSMSSIAAKFGVSLDALIAANPQNPNQNLIYPDWIVHVPGNPPAAPAPVSGNAYTVRPGDSLSGIAAQFGTTINAILAINSIPNPNLIYPGQTIQIPSQGTGVSGTVYTVVSGDSLSAIAARYGTDWQTLANANGISNPDLIYPGEPITIP